MSEDYDIFIADGIVFYNGIIINQDVIGEVYKMMLKESRVQKVYRVAWWNSRFLYHWDYDETHIDPELNARFLLYCSSLRPPEIAPVIKGMYYVFFKSEFSNLSLLADVEDEQVIRNTLGLSLAYGSGFDADYVGTIDLYKTYNTALPSPFNQARFSNKKN